MEKKNDLTHAEACVLLETYCEIKTSHKKAALKVLQQKGYIDDSGEITTTGKERVANHMLKEKNLPNYVTYNSLGTRFDSFLSTASANAVNGFLMSILNQNKLKGIDTRTLSNLEAECNKEIQRQVAVSKLMFTKPSDPS